MTDFIQAVYAICRMLFECLVNERLANALYAEGVNFAANTDTIFFTLINCEKN